MLKYNYAADMSRDARAWAILSGVAAGWLQSSEMPTYQIGCCQCGFFYRWAITMAELDEYNAGMKGVSAEDLVERRVEVAFLNAANNCGCPHWMRYLSMHKSTEIAGIASNLALDMLIATLDKRGKHAII